MSKTWEGHYIKNINGEDYVLFKDYLELDKEIERLNNIINKYDIFLKHELSFEGHSVEWIENKLQELKGDSSNE